MRPHGAARWERSNCAVAESHSRVTIRQGKPDVPLHAGVARSNGQPRIRPIITQTLRSGGTVPLVQGDREDSIRVSSCRPEQYAGPPSGVRFSAAPASSSPYPHPFRVLTAHRGQGRNLNARERKRSLASLLEPGSHLPTSTPQSSRGEPDRTAPVLRDAAALTCTPCGGQDPLSRPTGRRPPVNAPRRTRCAHRNRRRIYPLHSIYTDVRRLPTST